MDRDTFEQWIRDLRSGAFEQGQGFLKCEGELPNKPCTYCCLGVLGERLVEQGKGYFELENRLYYFVTDNLFSSKPEEAFLPDLLMDSVLQDTLSSANDRGASFTEIADSLEAHFIPLFDQLTKKS